MIRISDAGHQRQLIYDRYVKYLFVASAFLVSLLIFFHHLFCWEAGLMTFADVSPLEFFFSKWAPESQQYGALSFIVGSLQTTFLAVLIGTPLGLAGALFLAKVAPQRLRALMRPAMDALCGDSSVVYGYIGITVWCHFTRRRWR